MWINVFINMRLILIYYRKMFDYYFFLIDDSYIYQLSIYIYINICVCVCVYQMLFDAFENFLWNVLIWQKLYLMWSQFNKIIER